MAAAATGRPAATAARHGAAAAALHALLDAVPNGASRAAARLLLRLRKLAAALGVEPSSLARRRRSWWADTRTCRRREQRRAALARLRSNGAAHGNDAVAGCRRGGREEVATDGVGGKWFQDLRARPAAGERRAAGDETFEATETVTDV